MNGTSLKIVGPLPPLKLLYSLAAGDMASRSTKSGIGHNVSAGSMDEKVTDVIAP